MEISYNRLFKLLIDKDMKKTEFAKIAGLTPGTLAKLSKNQTISMDSLIKICTTLNCSFDDIVEIVNNIGIHTFDYEKHYSKRGINANRYRNSAKN